MLLMITLKKAIVLFYDILYFMIISIPIACLLYFTAHLFFKIKILIKWITN
jgi:hypothetical protein